MPKLTARVLTDRTIDNAAAKASRYEVPDGGCTGLYLVVQPTGAKSWAVRYRWQGKPEKLSLGLYSSTDLTLAKARIAARKILADVSEGTNPKAKVEEVVAEAPPQLDSVGTTFDEFIRQHLKAKRDEVYAREVEQNFNLRIRPQFGDRPINDLKQRELVIFLDKVAETAPYMANRTHAHLRKFFHWCIEKAILEVSPLVNIPAPAEEEARDRVLSDDEIRLLWKACERKGYPFGTMTQMLLLTAQRRNEISDSTWPEYDLTNADASLTIPAKRAKNNKETVVPLSASAVALMTAAPKKAGEGNFAFTTSGKAAVSGFSKAKAEIDAMILTIAKEEAAERGDDPETVTLTDWRFHDLRRTAATGMASLRIPPHVVEAVLNHKSGTIKGVAAVYNRWQYADEKREALDKWSSLVARIVDPSPNVIPMQAR